jgi:predicted NAD-dependent protein-ADP-ribosyltransferase YbiA (DUF1768 family)
MSASVNNSAPSIEPSGPVYFFGAHRVNGYLSQMYPSSFEHEGNTYATNEHYFQISKARMFKDSVSGRQRKD